MLSPTRSISNRIQAVHTHPMVSGFNLEKLFLAYTLCRHIGLLLGKRLEAILLRRRIRKHPNSLSILDSSRIYFSSTLEGGFKNIRIRCQIRRMRVDGS